MAEESAVNYWEVSLVTLLTPRLRSHTFAPVQKYGHVAFDSSQKAVLTSCVLRYKPVLNSGGSPVVSKATLGGAQIASIDAG